MCTCNNLIGNGGTIADFFRANENSVSRVFRKWGMTAPHIEPTPEWAVVGTAANGTAFAKEVGAAAAGGDISNAGGLTEEQAGQGNAIMGWITQAVNSGVNIANTVIGAQAQAKGQPVIIQTPWGPQLQQQQGNQQGNPAYYQQYPQQPAPPAAGGLNSTQLFLLLGTAAVIVALFFISRSPKA